jgi:glycosyltransferase involved in cell wall biosynthesis
MKILHIITLAELGGAQAVVLNLANEATLHGSEVMVASSDYGELWNILPSNIRQWKIKPLKRKIRPLDDIRVVHELRRINSLFRPDVVHLHSSKIGVLGRLAFPASKIVYTVHGFDSIRIAFRKFLYFERILQAHSRYIVSVSKYDLDNLTNEGITHHLKCIYNGINDCFQMDRQPANDRFTSLKSQILSKEGFKVLCIARISPQKKFDLFCQVAQQLKNYPIHFFWIGNKEDIADVPSNVYCMGQTENAHSLLEYADLFVLPTNYEGMPISIIEALCHSVPVVASNVGGVPEMLDGNNGIAVENNPGDFVDAILKYVDDKNFLATSRFAARKSYEDRFTVQKMYNAYSELYHSILLGQREPYYLHSNGTNDQLF